MAKLPRVLTWLVAVFVSLSSLAADPYPTKPVKIVVATGAGTVDDLPARIYDSFGRSAAQIADAYDAIVFDGHVSIEGRAA